MQEASEALEKFHKYIFNSWPSAQSQSINFVTLSPPITLSVSDNKYTKDWAINLQGMLIELVRR